MADTIRTITDLLTYLPLNVVRSISPQDLRDAVVSLANAYQELYTSGWKSLNAPVRAETTGPTTPSLDSFGPSGNLQALVFDSGDEVFFDFEVPYDIETGATMYPNVHWTTDGTSTNAVEWQLEYTIAVGHNQVGGEFGAPSTLLISEAASGTAWRHMTTESTGITAPEPGSVIVCRLSRTATGSNPDRVFALEVDIAYPSNRFARKNRTPDFDA